MKVKILYGMLKSWNLLLKHFEEKMEPVHFHLCLSLSQRVGLMEPKSGLFYKTDKKLNICHQCSLPVPPAIYRASSNQTYIGENSKTMIQANISLSHPHSLDMSEHQNYIKQYPSLQVLSILVSNYLSILNCYHSASM